MTETNSSGEMTKGEREELKRLVRERARIAKAGVAEREAELLASVEEQLSAEYQFNHEAWADLTRAAEEHVRRADAEVAQKCVELGIPERFRPRLNIGWYNRGESAVSGRRAELRAVAKARVGATGKKAKLVIDKAALEQQTVLVRKGLTTEDAIGFLGEMPTVEALMPAFNVKALEGGES